MHHKLFGGWALPGSAEVTYNTPTDLIAGLRVCAHIEGEGEKERGRGGWNRKEMERKGRGRENWGRWQRKEE